MITKERLLKEIEEIEEENEILGYKPFLFIKNRINSIEENDYEMIASAYEAVSLILCGFGYKYFELANALEKNFEGGDKQ